jgi:hypothetical protein
MRQKVAGTVQYSAIHAIAVCLVLLSVHLSVLASFGALLCFVMFYYVSVWYDMILNDFVLFYFVLDNMHK